VPLIFSADETADVGQDTAPPVSDDYQGERRRNGKALHVQGFPEADL